MSKMIRVDMTKGTVHYEPLNQELEAFGGRGLIAKILNDEVDPGCNPLEAENKLIICTGLLAGTPAPTSGRISIGSKSPLTGTIKEANAGGMAGYMLSRLGVKAIIVEGKSTDDGWFILKVGKDGAVLLPAGEYVGMRNYDLTEKMRTDFGEKVGVLSIGGAGERGYWNSTIQITDTRGRPSRSAARGGLGAVMGSKGLKAVVLEESGPPEIPYHEKELFNTANKNYIAGIKAHPVSGEAMPALGTAVLINIVNALGALPTNNFSAGNFGDAEKISGENLAKIQGERGGKENQPCQPGCPISCSNIYHDENGRHLTSGFEYETIALNGSNCGINDLDTIAMIDRMCDDFGLDTMETGTTIAVCMEAGKAKFGDGKAALGLVEEMIEGTELGKIMGNGTVFAGTKLGVKRIPVVKGQSIAAYDPRALKGTGVTYATSPMGADHTAGNSILEQSVTPTQKEGQVQVSTNLQVGMATFDNLGMCIFSGFCTEDPANIGYLLEMMSGRYGGEWDPDRLFTLGIKTLGLEKSFNSKAGFTEKDDALPEFMYTEKLPPTGSVFDIGPEELSGAVPFKED